MIFFKQTLIDAKKKLEEGDIASCKKILEDHKRSIELARINEGLEDFETIVGCADYINQDLQGIRETLESTKYRDMEHEMGFIAFKAGFLSKNKRLYERIILNAHSLAKTVHKLEKSAK